MVLPLPRSESYGNTVSTRVSFVLQKTLDVGPGTVSTIQIPCSVVIAPESDWTLSGWSNTPSHMQHPIALARLTKLSDACSMSKKHSLPRPADRLVQDLATQMEFLRRSCASYDDGFEGEACRLAVTLRVLLHNTQSSHALLTQAGVLNDVTLFADSSQPIDPKNLLPNLGLVIMKVEVGRGGEYAPRLDGGAWPLRLVPFAAWWGDPVSKDRSGNLWSRKKHVLTLAHKEGGAHVDPGLDPYYEALVTDNGFGMQFRTSEGDLIDFTGDPAAASVRQIAHESLITAKRLRLADGTRIGGLRPRQGA